MKKWPLITIACAVLLSGCTSIKFVPSLEERSRPQVTITNGRIAVDPEILTYFPDEREVLIVWQLPRDKRYQFPKDGIVIEGKLGDRLVAGPGVALERQDDIVNCQALSDI